MKLDHAATPGFVVRSGPPRVERCIVCRRWLRKSKMSTTGWRHSGLNP